MTRALTVAAVSADHRPREDQRMTDRHIEVASVAAVEALAEANGTRVIRAEGYASTTLPDATYFYAKRSVARERISA